jgi:hypothetical protein
MRRTVISAETDELLSDYYLVCEYYRSHGGLASYQAGLITEKVTDYFSRLIDEELPPLISDKDFRRRHELTHDGIDRYTELLRDVMELVRCYTLAELQAGKFRVTFEGDVEQCFRRYIRDQIVRWWPVKRFRSIDE